MKNQKRCPKYDCNDTMIREGFGWYCFDCKRHYSEDYIEGYHQGYLDCQKEDE